MQRFVSRLMSSFAVMVALVELPTAVSAGPRLVVTIPDTVYIADYNGQRLPIYFDNLFDTVGAFQLTVKSSRPGLVRFGGAQQSGTLISNFSLMDTYVMNADSSELEIYSQAVSYGGSNLIEGFAPQQGGVLVYIYLNVAEQVSSGVTAKSVISIGSPSGFSTPAGASIGAVPVTVWDTTYYQCLSWDGGSCTDSVKVDPRVQSFDIIAVAERTVPGLDSSIVWQVGGSARLVPPPYPMCDFDVSGDIDIGDLTDFIKCMFLGSGSCGTYIYCDWEEDNSVDIADLTAMIRYLFLGGAPLK